MTLDEVRPSEGSLIDRARAGDRAAFSELVRIHQDEVYTLATRLVGDRELAADVSQEALIRAWRALPKFRGDAKFSTWLHRIVVNAAWTQRRRQKRHKTSPMSEIYHEPVAAEAGPLDLATVSAMRPRLLEALRQLSPSLRAVVVLKDVYDWPHNEIAEHLGITTTAAKVRLHRARKRLHDLLWDELGGAD
ncbi:MAG: RNA polymerase sigma factor [Acidimicrobiia bacterium]|nr:RNA polymerase sigma factor [Acidimicrobiia bacterium]